MTEKSKTGTREWSDARLNVGIGCKNNCRYCYAAANALRFKRIASRADWPNEHLSLSRPSVPLSAKIIMSPTTHDLSSKYLEALLPLWHRLLNSGKDLLVVSKMDLPTAEMLAYNFRDRKSHVEFRISIGTMVFEEARWWEPGAPLPAERCEALKVLYSAGFATSVSAEPLLGTVETARLIWKAVEAFVTSGIWIGPLNKMEQRVENWQVHNLPCLLHAIQTPAWARNMMSEIQYPEIKWKDGMRRLAGKDKP